MSSVTALKGAASKAGMIKISDAGLVGMITLRGDLSSEKMAKTIQKLYKVDLPPMRGISHAATGAVAWMSPDELLLMLDYNEVAPALEKISSLLKNEHYLAVNVSDARSVMDLTGKCIRDVLAKMSPADLSKENLPLNEVRRTRLGQLAVAYWFNSDDHARLVCFRSVGEHVFAMLKNAAIKNTDVGYYSV